MITTQRSILFVRRGLTLIEMLVVLSLMAVLVVVSVSWMSHIMSRMSLDEERARWDLTAQRTLEQISYDLTNMDMIIDSQHHAARVRVENGELVVRTVQDGDSVEVRYVLDDSIGVLNRVTQDSLRDNPNSPALLGLVQSFNVIIDRPIEKASYPILRVDLVAVDGHSYTRWFLLTQEDIRQ